MRIYMQMHAHTPLSLCSPTHMSIIPIRLIEENPTPCKCLSEDPYGKQHTQTGNN